MRGRNLLTLLLSSSIVIVTASCASIRSEESADVSKVWAEALTKNNRSSVDRVQNDDAAEQALRAAIAQKVNLVQDSEPTNQRAEQAQAAVPDIKIDDEEQRRLDQKAKLAQQIAEIYTRREAREATPGKSVEKVVPQKLTAQEDSVKTITASNEKHRDNEINRLKARLVLLEQEKRSLSEQVKQLEASNMKLKAKAQPKTPATVWVEEKVVVTPEKVVEKIIPAEFEWIEEHVEITPEYSTYQLNVTTNQMEETIVPAKTIKLKKQILKSPARVVSNTVPAVTKTVKVQKNVSNQSAESYIKPQSKSLIDVACNTVTQTSKPWYYAPSSEPFVFEVASSAAILSGVVSHTGAPAVTASYYHSEIAVNEEALAIVDVDNTR